MDGTGIEPVTPCFAKWVLSQLSYTPTVGTIPNRQVASFRPRFRHVKLVAGRRENAGVEGITMGIADTMIVKTSNKFILTLRNCSLGLHVGI